MNYWVLAALTLVVLILLLNLFIYLFQDKLIFQGAKVSLRHQYKFNVPFEEFFIEPEDKARVHCLHFKVSDPKGCILYFHGNRGDFRRWGNITSHLTKFGYDVFVMDYRGYGKSIGKRTEDKLYEDASLFHRYVKDHFNFDKIIIFGRSLGSAMAVDLASQNPCDLLILETPISHIHNALYRYRWVVNKGLINSVKFDSINKVSQVSCPALILHGTRDEVVPIRFAKELMVGLASKEKKFIQINKGGHNNLNNFEFYHHSLKVALG